MLGSQYHFYKTKFVLQQLLMVEIAQVVSLGQRYIHGISRVGVQQTFWFLIFFKFFLSIYPGLILYKR